MKKIYAKISVVSILGAVVLLGTVLFTAFEELYYYTLPFKYAAVPALLCLGVLCLVFAVLQSKNKLNEQKAEKVFNWVLCGLLAVCLAFGAFGYFSANRVNICEPLKESSYNP
ncbi:MAG: hypothetical protein ACI4W6_05450 [Acutalibacteraceae bacterium]